MKKITLLSAIFTGLWLGSTIPAMAYSGEDYVVCNLNPGGDNFLSLRSCGSTKCRELLKLNPGTFLTTMEPNGERGWREVIVKRHSQDESYSGQSGWVYSRYICRIQH